MENREHIVADYFKLRLSLNRTNMIRDQKTEIEFIALKKGHEEYLLAATLKGIKNARYLGLCKIGLQGLWEPAEYSGLIYLEDFCARFLRKNLSNHFSSEDFNRTILKLKMEIQTLGISRE